jgi:hypothetical protein
MKNDFDEWKIFHGFDTTKFIVNILKNEFFVKDLVDMLSSHLLNFILLFVFTNMF